MNKVEEASANLAWPTVMLGIVLTAFYVLVPFLVHDAVITFGQGLFVMTLITYASYSVLHDAVHGAINGDRTEYRWINELLGYAAGWIMGVPLTAHRHAHLTHHRNTNIDGHDPDLSYAKAENFWLELLQFWSRATALQYKFYIKNRWNLKKGNQNRNFCLEILLQIGVRLLVMWQVGWWLGLGLFILSSLIGVTILVYLFAYIVHRPHDQSGRYKDTSTILIKGSFGQILTVLWAYQNYHSVHHLYPRVPFYRYPEVYEEIKDEMSAKGAPIFQLTGAGLANLKVS